MVDRNRIVFWIDRRAAQFEVECRCYIDLVHLRLVECEVTQPTDVWQVGIRSVVRCDAGSVGAKGALELIDVGVEIG